LGHNLVRLTSKGQMTLPVEIRRRLGLKEGDYLAVSVEGKTVCLRKVELISPLSPEDPMWELVGMGESGYEDVSSAHDRHLAEAEIARWHGSS